MKKIIETSKGRFVVIQKTSENSYPLDIWMSHYYPLIRYKWYFKLSEITEEEASSIVDKYCVNDNVYLTMYVDYLNKPLNCYKSAIQSLHSLLEFHSIEITNNTYIFKA